MRMQKGIHESGYSRMLFLIPIVSFPSILSFQETYPAIGEKSTECLSKFYDFQKKKQPDLASIALDGQKCHSRPCASKCGIWSSDLVIQCFPLLYVLGRKWRGAILHPIEKDDLKKCMSVMRQSSCKIIC